MASCFPARFFLLYCVHALSAISLHGVAQATSPPFQCAPSRLGHPCQPNSQSVLQNDHEPTLNLGAGNPIHLATGNKHQQETDMPRQPGPLGLELIRYYNSSDPRSSPLGRSWRLSYDTRLYGIPHRPQIVQADGSRIEFASLTEDSPTCLALQAGQGHLEQTATEWRWHWADGHILSFTLDGYLIRIQQDENQLEIQRHATSGPLQHAIASVSDPAGRTLTFNYEITPHGVRLAQVDTPHGPWRYQHDTPGIHLRLTGLQRPDGMTRTYQHEARGNLEQVPYLLTGITIGKDHQSLRIGTWHYDATGRANAFERPGDPASRIELQYLQPNAPHHTDQTLQTIVTSHRGRTRFEIGVTPAGYRLRNAQGPGCPGCPAPIGSIGYDAQNRINQIAGLSLQRDAAGAIVGLSGTLPGWPGLDIRYAPDGRLLGWQSDVTGLESWQTSADARMLLRRFANGDEWRYRYDHAQRLTGFDVRKAGGAWTTTRLDWHHDGYPARLQHPHETASWQITRQNAGSRIEQRISRPALLPGVEPLSYREHYEYDATGRLLRHALPEGGQLLYAWSEQGRLASIDWQDRDGHLRRVLDSSPQVPGYRHGNGWHTMGDTIQGQLRTLISHPPSGNPASPLIQHLRQDRHGRLSAEWLQTAQAQTTARLYGHDAQGRIGLIISASAPGHAAAERRYVAWGQAEDALATTSTTPAAPILRDASGLPTRIGNRQLEYSAQRRLTRVMVDSLPAGKPASLLGEYLHNASGVRIFKRAEGQDSHYLYHGHRLSAVARPATQGEADSGRLSRAWKVAQRYVYAQGIPIAMIDYGKEATDLHFIHSDAIGMPLMISDAQARPVWHIRPDALGHAARPDTTLAHAFPLRLPGQVLDPETGWHDNYLRTYDPTAGHYLEPDPIGPIPGNSAFGYAGQRFRSHADPLGLLLFAFDGTRNAPATRTNVWLMSQLYQDGSTFYIPGPGQPGKTDYDALAASSAHAIIDRQWTRLLQTLHARQSTHDYTAIDLVGFSRGAALARHFANRIAEHTQQGRFQAYDPALGQISLCVDLRFMGLFDSVAQMGLNGARNAEFDFSISPAWQWVAHAVALHEQRTLFPLTGLRSPGEVGANLVEAGFLGAHGDIGGGYLDTSTRIAQQGDLSDVALNWMLWQARASGLMLAATPWAHRQVEDPTLHDERLPYLRQGDRRMDAPNAAWLNAQVQHAQLGARARDALETFIQRVPEWQNAGGNDVGSVNMEEYGRWLEETLGFKMASPTGSL